MKKRLARRKEMSKKRSTVRSRRLRSRRSVRSRLLRRRTKGRSIRARKRRYSRVGRSPYPIFPSPPDLQHTSEDIPKEWLNLSEEELYQKGFEIGFAKGFEDGNLDADQVQ